MICTFWPGTRLATKLMDARLIHCYILNIIRFTTQVLRAVVVNY